MFQFHKYWSSQDRLQLCRDQEEEQEEDDEEREDEVEDVDEDVDDYDDKARRDVGQLQPQLRDDFTLATDTDATEWDENGLRLRIAPPKSAGLRRRLGDTRGAFAERLVQRQRDAAEAAKDPSKSRRRSQTTKRQSQQQDQLQTASATTVVDLLTRELRELSTQSLVKVLNQMGGDCAPAHKIFGFFASEWCIMRAF